MKKTTIYKSPAKIAGLFVITIILASCNNKNSNWQTSTVLKVNSTKLSAQEFAKRLSQKLKPFDVLTVKDELVVNQSKDEVTEDFIVESLILNWTRKNKFFIRKESLDKEILTVRENYPNDLAFRRSLAEENVSYKEWINKVRFSLLQKLLLKELLKNQPEISSVELKKYFDEHKKDYQRKAQVMLKQIVLENENNAQRILLELKKNHQFSALAKKYSITPEAPNGGNIGWIEQGTLDIYDSAFNMQIGQKSNIKKSPYGYHIYQVLNKRSAKKMTFAEVKDEIYRILLEKKQQEAYAQWLEAELRKSKVFKDEKLIRAIEVNTEG